MGALGIIEDEMAELQPWYAQAAGWMAEWEHEHRRMFLHKKAELQALGHWDKSTTETAKKDDVEYALQLEHAALYEELKQHAKTKAIGDKLFQSLDARRSIGQTLMKPHLADEPRYGQGAQPQPGQP
jgi:hypothetical protein